MRPARKRYCLNKQFCVQVKKSTTDLEQMEDDEKLVDVFVFFWSSVTELGAFGSLVNRDSHYAQW